jgi:PAS domain S-box-containing protein
VLSARLAGLQQTVIELAASDDLDTMLAMIVDSAARAVTAPAFVLALDTLPAATRRVYARGLNDAEAEQVAARLLPAASHGGGRTHDEAGVLAVDVASTHHRYGLLAAFDPRGRRQYLVEERLALEAYASIAAATLDVTLSLDTARRQATVAEAMADLLADERTLLSGIVEGLPHGVCWADRSGLTGCNRALVDLLGYAGVEDVVGRQWDQLCPRADASRLLSSWVADVIASGEPVINRELAIGDDGSRKTLLVSVAPLRGHDGDGRVLSIWADVTEQRSMEQRLAETSRLESIGQLAAGVAHEINTPLQYIASNGAFLNAGFERMAAMVDELVAVAASYGAETASLDAITSKAKLDVLRSRLPQAAGEIIEGVDAVSQIVRSLKTFSSPSGDDFEPVDLAEVMDSTIVVSRNEWKNLAELELDIPAALPPVRAVQGMINQVILNLIVNAADAIDDRHQAEGSDELGAIAITCRLVGDRIETEVADDGNGIPEAIRDKVYDQFFTTKAVGEGIGQGLAICRNIITRHHGTIDYTTSSQGTTFIVSLPVWHDPV